MKNHIIIGSGGTGGRIIKELRRILYNRFAEAIRRAKQAATGDEQADFDFRDLTNPGDQFFQTVAQITGGIFIDFCYVDSSERDLKASRQWSLINKDGDQLLGLPAQKIVELLNQGDLKVRLENPDRFPLTNTYMGRSNAWADIVAAHDGAIQAGGQMRRMGEFLFECQANEFVSRIVTLSNEIENASGRQGIHFHIFAGLAGGTGSGSFLHIIAQLRHRYPDAATHKIHLHTLVPEVNSPWAKNGTKTNYYANGYAGLRELNAYTLTDRIGEYLWNPLNLSQSNEVSRLSTLGSRCQSMFVISETNGEQMVDPRERELPALLAEFVYRKLWDLNEEFGGEAAGVAAMALSGENLMTPDETEFGELVRRRKFLTIGIKKLFYPEQKIKVYFGSRASSQVIGQLAFDHWNKDGREYMLKEKAGSTFEAELKSLEWRGRQDILLDAAHLTLSTPILSAERGEGVLEYDRYWESASLTIKEQIKEYPKSERMDMVDQWFDHYETKDFRGVGVEGYFNQKTARLEQSGSELAVLEENLNSDILDRIRTGQICFHSAKILIEQLAVDASDDDPSIIKRWIAELRDAFDSQQKLKMAAEDRMRKKNIKRQNMGNGWRWFIVFDTFFGEYVDSRRAKASAECWMRSLRYACELLEKLQNLIQKQGGIYSGVTGCLEQSIESARGARNDSEKLCPAGYQMNARQLEIEAYESSRVIDAADAILHNDRYRSVMINRCRQEAIDQTLRDSSDDRSLVQLLKMWPVFESKLRRLTREDMLEAHVNETPVGERVIGQDIITILQQEFGNDAARLREFARGIVESARPMAAIRDQEGDDQSDQTLIMIVPASDENPRFRESLVGALRDQSPIPNTRIFEPIRSGAEIILISSRVGLSLRQLARTHRLKELHDERMSDGSAEIQVYLEHHGNVPTTRMPDLLPAVRPSLDKAMPYVLILNDLGLTSQSPHPINGRKVRIFKINDAAGISTNQELAEEFFGLLSPPPAGPDPNADDVREMAIGEYNAYREITAERFHNLKNAVVNELRVSYSGSGLESKRKTLADQRIQTLSDCTEKWLGGNQNHEAYKRHYAATQEALELIKRLAGPIP